MKKLYLLLVMLCMSFAAYAGVTATFLANSSNVTVTNGKGFVWNHTAYQIDVENVGDLASADLSALSDAQNESNKYNMEDGTYFVINGTLNAADIAALNNNFGSSTNPVYVDFSNATFVDGEGATVTDGSLLSNLTNSKIKYVVLPNSTTEIDSESLPPTIEEALAVNVSENLFLGYASGANGGTLEHLIAFDNRPAKNENIYNYTLSGTFNHGAETYEGTGDYVNVFSYLYTNYGYNQCYVKNLDLTNATFPNYNEPKEYKDKVPVTTLDGSSEWREITITEDMNALGTISQFFLTIETVKLPETAGTTLIPFHSFNLCSKLQAVEIPGNITTLGSFAFSQCSGLQSLKFNEGLTTMGTNCFWACESLTSVQLPVGLKNIGNYAFVACNSLADIVIPEGVELLGVGCFERTNITTVRLPHSLVTISENAFRQCKSLRTITIPENVELIDHNAFALCNSITDVYFLGTTTIPHAPVDAFDSKLYFNNNGVAGVQGTDWEGVHQGQIVTLPDYEDAGIHNYTDWYRDNITLRAWVEFDENGVKTDGAAFIHYPKVAKEAEYQDADAAYVNGYIAARDNTSVDATEPLYVKNDDDSYSKIYGTPVAGTTYYTQSVVQNGSIKSTTSPVDGVSEYYSNEDATQSATPKVTGEVYYECGVKNTYSDAVYTLQKDADNNWIETYYTKDASGKYTESPYIYFKDDVKLYYSPVSQTVTKYSETTTPVAGVTTYYSDEDGTEVTPTLDNTYYYNVQNVPVPTYTSVNYLQEGATAYFSDANGESSVNPTFNGTYWYVSETETKAKLNKISAWNNIPDTGIEHLYDGNYNIITPPFNTTYYYLDNNAYVATNKFVDGVSQYFIGNENDNKTWDKETSQWQYNSYIAATEVKITEDAYYVDTTETVEVPKTYTSTTEFVPGKVNSTDYYTKDASDNYTQMYSGALYFNMDYYYQSGTHEEQTATAITQYDPTVSQYYLSSGSGYYSVNNVTFNNTYYYEDGTKTVTTYSETDHFIPGVETYYEPVYDGYQEVTNWAGRTEAYYYKTGTEPDYCSADGTVYDATRIYYADATASTRATSISFDDTYYYNSADYSYSPVSAEDLNVYILKNSTLYDAEGNAVDASAVTSGGSYKQLVSAATDDYYGQWYTVPDRNNNYGGTYVGSEDENYLNSNTWPDRADMSKWSAGTVAREGISTPDGTEAGTYDGLKNFILAAGYQTEEEDPTTPVQKVDHIKKDVWYTMCFPFDLTDDQLKAAFGSGYEVAQFCAVVENDEKTGIILQFTDAVNPDANGVVTKAHVPYMIHPHSKKVDASGNPATLDFYLSGIKETMDDHNAVQETLMANAVTVTAFDGSKFTFVGYGHNYLSSQVLIPRYAYFLGTKSGETFPRFFRQTGADNRASGSYWNKNIAVVLPGVDKSDDTTCNFNKIDERTINSDTSGKELYEVWNEEKGYYNYVCSEYRYTPSASTPSVKSLASFDIQIVHTPLTEAQPEETTAVETIETAEPAVAADKLGKVYTISGQYVGNDLNNLPKGIYILNGKKYMVR